MDVEPIYCAEQIVVPVDLADILKAYTKEVIRRHPEDLIEFSARYFRNLADIASTAQEASAPSQDQISLFYQRVGEGATLTPEQVHAVASQLGIAKGVVAKVLGAGRFASAVNLDKFLFLLLVMSCENFGSVLQSVFKVFGHTLDANRFQGFIAHLAPDMDPDITSQFLSELNSTLLDVQLITYADAIQIPCIAAKL